MLAHRSKKDVGVGVPDDPRPFAAAVTSRVDMESAPTDFVFALGGKNSTIFIIFYLFFII